MRFALTLLTLLLVAVIGISAALLLRSCGVRLPFSQRIISVCENADLLALRADLAVADRANADLSSQVGALEQQLAGLVCEADPPPLPPPPPPPRPKPPAKPKTPSGLAPDAFDGRDMSVMEGCWQLSSDYAVRDINTGKITRFKYWRICFDKNGNGTEQMRSTDGARCNGRLRGRMPGNGTLTMREPGNLQCDNGASIFRRDVTCKLDARGTAKCDTYQPETRGRGEATLRRAGR
ncbi:hypothetical protein [Sedimentitalea nanhaiensis]|uniref:Uncharacterized protein n=1 Tax=Sedimentitalea nanhaiensis TaxID=999627 RepID=A0A1I6ZWD0_9RHOB|nr:hypothetical protein [Sedimentitalea nanhaiensis]SFT66998.1 hypothetical protein SAMN05216236_10524 [Sedimentitalea nanhaiensis]